jgi:tetratricopeptide (TPR) repeat protein
MQARRLRTLPIVLILWVLSSGAGAAQTSGPSLDQSVDHAAACGLFQLGKDFRRALKHCDRALEDDPGDHSTLLNRGSAQLVLGNLEEALSDFEKAIAIKPEDARNYFNRALVHAAKKDHRRAIADYTEAIRIMPSLAIGYNNRAYELEAMGEVKQAITDYREALRLARSLAAVIRPNLQRLGAEP